MIIHPTTDKSAASGVPGVACVSALITKLVAGVIVPTVNSPKAVEAPTDCLHVMIKEDAVTDVVATVAVPDANVTEPIELAPAVVVVPTDVLRILFPDVPRTKFPLVAVMGPVVAVTPVPPVTVVPADTVVPPAKVVVVVKEPGVVMALGSETVATFATVLTVIWFAVPSTEDMAPVDPPV